MFDSLSAPGRNAAGWPAYYRWNQAIAETVFSPDAAGLPVYLDLEEELLARLTREAGADGDPRRELAAAVRATLELESGRTSVFRRHENLVIRWRHGSLREMPPTLALLALLSLAAEVMRGGEGMSANNYYGRLCEFLEVNDRSLKDKVERDYRKCAEELWGSLNDWLLAWEGERGLPTAEALGHRHIGLPISQALVRAGDRRRLRDFFTATGLPPGGTVTPAEMEPLLGAWIDHEPSPVSNALRALWKRHEEVRGRVAALASLELSSWSGAEAAPVSAADHVRSLRLVALLRRFPSVRLELSLAIRLPPAECPTEVTFARTSTGDGSSAGGADVAFEALGEGWLRLGDPDLFEAESLVAGAVGLEARALALVAERKPRRLVPLRWDESLQLFVEADRVHLGEDSLLLCRTTLADRVGDLLEVIARPGFRRQPMAAAGLPDWVVFTDVQVLAAPDPVVAERGRDDLWVLLPATASQVLVAGGLQMPGRARKWSSLLPPEVRVVVAPGALTQVVVAADVPPGDKPRHLAEAMADGGAVVLALQDRRLPDGDYVVETRMPGVRQPLTRTRVRLRSADTPVLRAPAASPLAYPLEETAGLGPLSAAAYAGQLRYAEGARVHGADPGHARLAGQRLLTSPVWLEAAPTRPRVGPDGGVRKLQLGTVDPASCVVTGAHRFELPGYRGVGPSLRPHSGCCSGCGLVKWFGHPRGSGYQAAAGKRIITRPAAPLPSPAVLHSIAPVRHSQQVPWDAGLDALCHLGSGSAADLERIALQLQGERLFVHQFTQVLEALGHLDVERDPRSLRLRRWQVPPPVLAGLPSGGYVLAGWRSRQVIAAVTSCAAAKGGRVERDRQAGAPSLITVSGLSGDQATRVAARVRDPNGQGLYLQPDAAASLAAALPPLGALLDALPRVTLPAAQSVERWDTAGASWARAGLVDRPGAYKLRGPLVRYGLCTEHDLANGTFALGASQVVKHLAALLAGTMHVAYDERSSCLLVPFGAGLPGLYGRAAVLCSGRAPAAASGQRLLLYQHVPPEIARAIAHALTH